MCKLLKQLKIKITRQDKSRIRQVLDYAADKDGDQFNTTMYEFCKLLENGLSIKEAAAAISNDEII